MRQPSPSLFHGRHFDRTIIILRVRWYITSKLSHRDLVEMMAEREARCLSYDNPMMGPTLRPGVREAVGPLLATCRPSVDSERRGDSAARVGSSALGLRSIM